MTMPTTLSHFLNGLIVFCFVSAAALTLYSYSYSSSSSDSEEVCFGCFMPIKHVDDDPSLRLKAEFAISEYNKKMQSHQPRNHLVFRNLVQAKSQLVNGINFMLVIAAVNQSTTSPSTPQNYEAVVYVDFKETQKKLVSFKLA